MNRAEAEAALLAHTKRYGVSTSLGAYLFKRDDPRIPEWQRHGLVESVMDHRHPDYVLVQPNPRPWK